MKKILLSTILLVVLTGCGTHEAEVTTEQPAEEVSFYNFYCKGEVR